MSEYNHNKIEKKWQNYWNNNQTNKVDLDSTENKKYVLTMFSYPSGDKLHIGHWYNFGPVDWCQWISEAGRSVVLSSC